MHVNENTKRLIAEATQEFRSWSYARGNYRETSLDRTKLVELVVRECCEKITRFEQTMLDDRNSEYAQGWIMSRRLAAMSLYDHFGLND